MLETDQEQKARREVRRLPMYINLTSLKLVAEDTKQRRRLLPGTTTLNTGHATSKAVDDDICSMAHSLRLLRPRHPTWSREKKSPREVQGGEIFGDHVENPKLLAHIRNIITHKFGAQRLHCELPPTGLIFHIVPGCRIEIFVEHVEHPKILAHIWEIITHKIDAK